MNKVYFDFETSSEIDVTKANASVYAKHPSTEILCCTFQRAGESFRLVIRDGEFEYRKAQIIAFCKGGIFVAHNASFEWNIWYHVLHKRMGYPMPPLSRWRCTMAKVLAHGLPRSLGKAADALDLPQQKFSGERAFLLKMCKPTGPRDAEAFDRLIKYNIQDVVATKLLDEALPDLSEKEQKVWELDQTINQRGVKIDRALCENMIRLLAQEKAELLQEFQGLAPGLTSPTQRALFLELLNSLDNLELQNTQKATLVKVLKDPSLPDTVRRLIELRQILSKTSNAKWNKLLTLMEEDDRIRQNLIYHGAATGRWSGQGAQLQNLPRPKIKAETALSCMDSASDFWPLMWGSCSETASSLIRSAIIS